MLHFWYKNTEKLLFFAQTFIYNKAHSNIFNYINLKYILQDY